MNSLVRSANDVVVFNVDCCVVEVVMVVVVAFSVVVEVVETVVDTMVDGFDVVVLEVNIS